MIRSRTEWRSGQPCAIHQIASRVGREAITRCYRVCDLWAKDSDQVSLFATINAIIAIAKHKGENNLVSQNANSVSRTCLKNPTNLNSPTALRKKVMQMPQLPHRNIHLGIISPSIPSCPMTNNIAINSATATIIVARGDGSKQRLPLTVGIATAFPTAPPIAQ